MKRFLKYVLLSVLSVMMIITQTACSSEVKTVSKDNYYLDTTCNITVLAADKNGATDRLDEELASKAIDDAYKLCALLDKTLSRTVEVSDISKINNAGCEWTEISSYTLSLLKSGIEYSKQADGLFDITVGRLTSLWDFHADDPKVPNAADIDDAIKHIGFDCIEIDGNRARLTDPDMCIDLGGIAKGYVADRMADFLEEEGVTSAVVNLGGNVVCIGKKPDGSDFSVGVEAPFSDRTEIVGAIEASDKTLVTSGVYERMFEIDGKLYHHILDPNTGYSAKTDLDAVTLIADKGHSMDCDAMSTICLIKGYEQARKYIERKDGVEAVFILSNGNIETTDGAGLIQ